MSFFAESCDMKLGCCTLISVAATGTYELIMTTCFNGCVYANGILASAQHVLDA